jgi:hypothetical protein
MVWECHHCKNIWQSDIAEPCPLCKCKVVKIINKPNKHHNGTPKKHYQRSIKLKEI